MSWMMIAIFAPEFVLWTCFQQFQEARAVCLQVRQETNRRRGICIQPVCIFCPSSIYASYLQTCKTEQGQCAVRHISIRAITGCINRTFHKWFPRDLEFGYYVVMGGYEIIDSNGEFMGTVTPLGALQLAREGLLPEVSTDQINDKSKADSLAKTLVCIQASWMLVQCIARKVEGLPITLLEINTVMHVVCALCMYLLWLKKPQNVMVPTTVFGPNSASPPSPEELGQSEKIIDNIPSWLFANQDERILKQESASLHIYNRKIVGSIANSASYTSDTFSWFAVVLCGVYGGAHLTPWNGHFATHIERYLWRVAGCLVVGAPIGITLATTTYGKLSAAGFSGRYASRGFRGYRGLALYVAAMPFLVPIGAAIAVAGGVSIAVLYPAARGYLVVEAFASLRSLPRGAYTTVYWVEMIPHF